MNVTCNPNKNTEPLGRCPAPDTCTSAHAGWPTRDDLNAALEMDSFSHPDVFNKYSTENFANYVEGYMYLQSERCDEAVLCNHDNKSCRALPRKLHNSVSLCCIYVMYLRLVLSVFFSVIFLLSKGYTNSVR